MNKNATKLPGIQESEMDYKFSSLKSRILHSVPNYALVNLLTYYAVLATINKLTASTFLQQ